MPQCVTYQTLKNSAFIYPLKVPKIQYAAVAVNAFNPNIKILVFHSQNLKCTFVDDAMEVCQGRSVGIALCCLCPHHRE